MQKVKGSWTKIMLVIMVICCCLGGGYGLLAGPLCWHCWSTAAVITVTGTQTHRLYYVCAHCRRIWFPMSPRDDHDCFDNIAYSCCLW